MSRAKRALRILNELYKEYGEPFVDEVVDTFRVERAQKSKAKTSTPPRRTYTVTPEATPGYSTQHRRDVQSAPFAVRKKYQRDMPWVREGRDVLYEAQGIPQRTDEGVGAYINSAGDMEMNPVNVTGLSVAENFSPADRERILATEKLRGVIDAQEAVAGNMPVLDPSGNAMYFGMGRTPSAEEMEFFARQTPSGFGTTATSGGALTFPFDPGASAEDVAGVLGPWSQSVQEIASDVRGVPVRNDMGFYEPAMGRFDENYEIVPTEPFSGQATMDVLSRFAGPDVDPQLARMLSSNEGVKDAILGKYYRDFEMPGVRGDIQNTRQFFANEDWSRVVDLIRKGVSPAAALAALGYSASSLAAPTQE